MPLGNPTSKKESDLVLTSQICRPQLTANHPPQIPPPGQPGTWQVPVERSTPHPSRASRDTIFVMASLPTSDSCSSISRLGANMNSSSLEWRDLSVEVGGPAPKEVLSGVSGSASPGDLVALMGPTGSGKTTLLSALGRRLAPGARLTGTVRYGGTAWTSSLRRHVAFVEQDDVVAKELTMREALTYLAALRLPHLSPEERDARVSGGLSSLKLESCADSKTSVVSGGERKRLCLADALLVDPAILLCDEPTSGLDSSTAHVIAQALHELVTQQEICAIVSIHQPSSRLFAVFSSLVMLNKGSVFYAGARDASPAWCDLHGYPVPNGWSTCDHMLELATEGTLDHLLLAAAQDPEKGAAKEEMHEEGAASGAKAGLVREAAPLLTQLSVLLQRQWHVVRGDVLNTKDTAMHLMTAAYGAILWYQIGNTEVDVLRSFTCCFQIALPWFFFSLFEMLPFTHAAEPMLLKELRSGTYSLAAWFLAVPSVAAAKLFLYSSLNISVILAFTGVCETFESVVAVFAVVWLMIAEFQSIGLALSASFPMSNVIFAGFIFVTFCFVFAGLMGPVEESPMPFLRFVNPVFWNFSLVAHAT